MRAPVLAVGDGALGFWNALREAFPEAQEGRRFVPQDGERPGRAAEVRAPGGEEGAGGDWGAEDKEKALAALKALDAAYGAKFPKAVAKVTDDADELLAFFNYPAEYWVHLRTTNLIESTFATVRHRTRSPGAPAHGRPGWPWRSGSPNPPRTAGDRSTHHTWSPWSAPVPAPDAGC